MVGSKTLRTANRRPDPFSDLPWTFFIASPEYGVPGATDTANWPYPVYVGVEALNDGSSTSGALSTAQEWGHSFGLHSHTIYPNLMFPFTTYGLQESLTTNQRQTARQGATMFR